MEITSGDPLLPVEIDGGSKGRLFFDPIRKKWRSCNQGDSAIPGYPYSVNIVPAESSSPAVWCREQDYAPLATQQPEIRVLVILPSEAGKDALKCFLVHVCLNDYPPYVALSYTWGDKSQKESISLNEKLVMVQKNLHDALKRLRRSDHLEFIWADAVSIDQNNIEEKDVQVPLMGRIYSEAKLTVAWLGEHSEDSEFAIAEIKHLGKAFWEIHNDGAMLGRYPNPPTPPGLTLRSAIEKTSKLFMSERSPEFRQAVYKAIVALMSRPYWERVWTQQEMILPSFMGFACGTSDLFGLLDLVAVWQVLQRYRLSGDKSYKSLSGQSLLNRAMLMLMLSLPQNKHKAQLKYLIIAESLHAEDPRDHVYGLLGLAGDSGSLDIKVAYSRPVELVYSDLIRAFVKKGDLDLIACSQFPKKLAELPSWVPDWTSYIRITLPGVAIDQENYVRFTACGETTAKAEVLTDNDQAILRIEGVRLGSVQYVGHDWTAPDQADVETEEPRRIGLGLLVDITDLILKHMPTADDQILKDISYEMLRAPDPNEGLSKSDGTEVGTETAEMSYRESFEALWSMRDFLEKPLPEFLDEQTEYDILQMRSKLVVFCESAVRRIVEYKRRLFVTDRGFFGLGPSQVERGDVAAVMFGASVPYVLKKRFQARHKFVGTAYVREAMKGEVFAGHFQEETFELE